MSSKDKLRTKFSIMRCLRYSALHGIEDKFTHDCVKELFKNHSTLLTLEDIT